MTMVATILTRNTSDGEVVTGAGTYETYQDPDSFEILTRWVPATVDAPGAQSSFEVPCYARGYTDLGFRSSANREVILKGDYDVFEAVEFFFPAKYKNVTRQSYVTNIYQKNRPEVPLWTEEETGRATVFQVQGITPVFDPFGRLREWTGVLTRAEVQ